MHVQKHNGDHIVHGDMLFFPMIARFYDWKSGTWTTLEQMEKDNENTGTRHC